ncbi:hypothetical protein IEQ34_002429 [Dendrobium chrysotoxum]|uniref:Uncharacterized protein n=1 Tax=Dendrobium chrysotoxum TaxID=161865 RepID=A0AAV7HJU5_DENCH|nr:hypothetical protein IEQ34_002429 [Dendrobium chrysotoxum]
MMPSEKSDQRKKVSDTFREKAAENAVIKMTASGFILTSTSLAIIWPQSIGIFSFIIIAIIIITFIICYFLPWRNREQGIDEVTLESYPKVMYSEDEVGSTSNDTVCTICLSDYECRDVTTITKLRA